MGVRPPADAPSDSWSTTVICSGTLAAFNIDFSGSLRVPYQDMIAVHSSLQVYEKTEAEDGQLAVYA